MTQIRAVLFICVSGRWSFQSLLLMTIWISHATNIHVQGFVWIHAFFCLGFVFRNGMLFKMTPLYFSVGNSMGICGYLWGSSRVWNGCFIVCSYWQNVRTISLHHFQQSLSVALVLWGSMNCISLWFGSECPQENLVTICMSSLERPLFRPLSVWVFFYHWIISHSLCFFFFGTGSLSDISLCMWFIPFCDYGVTFPDGVLWNAKVFTITQFSKLNFVTEHGAACL